MRKRKSRLSLRVDPQRTAAAAEAYVEAMLIRSGVWTHRPCLRNQEGFDLVCTSGREKRRVRVQIKGRWATDAGSPKIRSDRLDAFDFLIFVRLNAGYHYRKAGGCGGAQEPILYVFPKAVVKRYFTKESKPGKGFGGKFRYSEVPKFEEKYRGESGLDLLAAKLGLHDLETQATNIVTGRQ
jgi:hypothetical protein